MSASSYRRLVRLVNRAAIGATSAIASAALVLCALALIPAVLDTTDEVAGHVFAAVDDLTGHAAAAPSCTILVDSDACLDHTGIIDMR